MDDEIIIVFSWNFQKKKKKQANTQIPSNKKKKPIKMGNESYFSLRKKNDCEDTLRSHYKTIKTKWLTAMKLLIINHDKD